MCIMSILSKNLTKLKITQDLVTKMKCPSWIKKLVLLENDNLRKLDEAKQLEAIKTQELEEITMVIC